MSVLDTYVNPNETRVLEEQVRGALAWNLHSITYHHDADDKTKRSMVTALIDTASAKIGKDKVADIVDEWTKRMKAAVNG